MMGRWDDGVGNNTARRNEMDVEYNDVFACVCVYVRMRVREHDNGRGVGRTS